MPMHIEIGYVNEDGTIDIVRDELHADSTIEVVNVARNASGEITAGESRNLYPVAPHGRTMRYLALDGDAALELPAFARDPEAVRHVAGAGDLDRRIAVEQAARRVAWLEALQQRIALEQAARAARPQPQTPALETVEAREESLPADAD